MERMINGRILPQTQTPEGIIYGFDAQTASSCQQPQHDYSQAQPSLIQVFQSSTPQPYMGGASNEEIRHDLCWAAEYQANSQHEYELSNLTERMQLTEQCVPGPSHAQFSQTSPNGHTSEYVYVPPPPPYQMNQNYVPISVSPYTHFPPLSPVSVYGCLPPRPPQPSRDDVFTPKSTQSRPVFLSGSNAKVTFYNHIGGAVTLSSQTPVVLPPNLQELANLQNFCMNFPGLHSNSNPSSGPGI